MYYFDFGDHHVVGASPEILVRLAGDTVTLRPIAGTRPRGATPEADAAIAEELLADPKERAEHVMLIDLGRNDVGRVAATGSVKVTERMVIERYSHVMHIVSNVEGRLAPGLDAIDVLKASFPAGTVTGAPKVRAMQIIDELEPVKRGVYSGAVGYLGFNGDMDVAIAIRTAVVKDRRLNVQAAAGIVADSDPRSEWLETQHKARALLRAAEIASSTPVSRPRTDTCARTCPGSPARGGASSLDRARWDLRGSARDSARVAPLSGSSKPRNFKPSRAIIDSTSGSVKRCSCTWNSRSRQPLML